MIKWRAGLAALFVVLMAQFIALAAFTGFADIPPGWRLERSQTRVSADRQFVSFLGE